MRSMSLAGIDCRLSPAGGTGELRRRFAVDQDQHIGVSAQRYDAVRIHVDGRNHAQDIAQCAESTLHIRCHRVDLAVDERFDVELLRRDDDGLHGISGGRRRAVCRMHDRARCDDQGIHAEPYRKVRRTDTLRAAGKRIQDRRIPGTQDRVRRNTSEFPPARFALSRQHTRRAYARRFRSCVTRTPFNVAQVYGKANDSLRSDARREFSAARGIVTDHRGVVAVAPSRPCMPLGGLIDLVNSAGIQ